MTKQDASTDSSKGKKLIELAEGRVKRFRRWAELQWFLHALLMILSIIMAAIVPFGLAMLLYIETAVARKQFNLILLALSAASLILQLVDSILGLRYRARLLRIMQIRLEEGVAKFQDGVIDINEFHKFLSETSTAFIEEEGA